MAITISSSFDAGNIRVVAQDGDRADLEIVTDHLSDFYQWFYFRVAGAAGREIKLRSPYRDTFVFELANDYVGYIPDARAYDRGGYQTWTGLHSYLEKGSDPETIVAAIERAAAGIRTRT